MRRDELKAKRDGVLQGVLENVACGEPLVVLKAPPGSGKTYVLTRAVALAVHQGRRVAVATQTNAQADDFCKRFAEKFSRFKTYRFASEKLKEKYLGASVQYIHTSAELPEDAGVVVGTRSKWGASDVDPPFDVLFVDEAWQMAWADFLPLERVSARFVLVGDPGQIEPVVAIDPARWQTSPKPPHLPAPNVLLRDATLPTKRFEQPVTTRLPYDTCQLVKAFYDFDFESWAAPNERRLVLERAAGRAQGGIDDALDLLTTGSVSLLTLPTPASGPPMEEDGEVVRAAVDVVRRLLGRGASAMTEDGAESITPADIGMSATHRVMNTRLSDALGDLAQGVRVDTPERWQGLERKVMVVVHPLSGVTKPSPFDLSTGRLCVMASRHRIGLVIVSRDHVGESLSEYLPVADQALGRPDEAGRGRAKNLGFWRQLEEGGRRVQAS